MFYLLDIFIVAGFLKKNKKNFLVFSIKKNFSIFVYNISKYETIRGNRKINFQ